MRDICVIILYVYSIMMSDYIIQTIITITMIIVVLIILYVDNNENNTIFIFLSYSNIKNYFSEIFIYLFLFIPH